MIKLLIKDPVYRLRMLAVLEGFSLIFLLFVSMPMKYYLGFATFSFYVGAIHGGLFVIYVILSLEVLIRRRYSFFGFLRTFIASSVPFGTFLNDKWLKKHQFDFAAA
ncbi:DUF3817 domain-containing protein [Pseudemcibacter aquimaris]|uniref:DUF3817 domain-containing protein n=1 Tax=Pseudemcibacter aquimaris TaxID=2857064 RepID=UPI00201189CE|nr:DUF3817 domain-containing protein [Pseudemcibacter aquimaris]MCC3859854.1 DUF3817 domain-containing protein [Pseudemcibacter aquimaris]WDU57186.1 DUF3817 domain-containing protein [Pseudemcibacter aquimaris]